MIITCPKCKYELHELDSDDPNNDPNISFKTFSCHNCGKIYKYNQITCSFDTYSIREVK